VKLVYCKLDPGNFGDELNPYLWPRLFPGAFSSDERIDFLGIGTILSPHRDRKGRRKVVFGAGAGYWKPPQINGDWTIHFVRGPLTAQLLGIPKECAITDAAYCLAFVDEPPVASSQAVVFMPHHKSETEFDWRSLCADLGWTYASPTSDVRSALSLLRSAKLVVSEAMHGAIVADLYRIPWIPIRYGFRSLDLKWRDWCESMSLEYRPVDLPPLLDAELGAKETLERLVKKSASLMGIGKEAWRATPVFRSSNKQRDAALRTLSALSKRGAGFLSPEPQFERAKAKLWDKVERFRSAYEH
jgi:succinoglycan biosynthesis protein ExoV